MSDENRTGSLTVVAAWVGLIASILTGGYTIGVQANRITNLEDQMRDKRMDDRESAGKLNQIQLDVRDIKSRFEVLVPTTPQRGR